MKALHKRRLLMLAEHLESGKLGHKEFRFSMLDSADGTAGVRHGCGTAGCAMGEMPVVFPKYFRYRTGDIALFMVGGSNDIMRVDNDIEEFLGLDSTSIHHLFYPSWQQPKKFGGRRLGSNATRQQVAANIRAFVKKMEA